MIPGLVVAALFYLWACRNIDLEDERRRIAVLDAGIENAVSVSDRSNPKPPNDPADIAESR
jgi:hypothetical protein